MVEAGDRRAILAGDITARVERQLEKFPVDLLFAPHHGSRTSSSAGFIKGFQPQVVFVSAARRSRYGHPHKDVLDRYRKSGARIYVTGWQGALIWQSDRPAEIRAWRHEAGAYWHQPAWSR
jgi:competence protein ComEC